MEKAIPNKKRKLQFLTGLRIDRIALIIILLIYLGVGISLINKYVANADGISYISIAQKYLQGDFKNAINGHWSPLYSWLLIPLIFFKIDPIIASKILALIISLFLLIGIYLLSSRFDFSNALRIAILLVYSPLLLCHVSLLITADLFITAIVVYYLYFVFDSQYVQKKNIGIYCAIFGVLAYFAKSYAFFFFLVHFTVLNVIYYFLSPKGRIRKRVISRYIISMLIFLFICSFWITALSLKYNKVTVSTAASWNFALIGSSERGNASPNFGFMPPPNNTAISTWEDPFYLPLPPWSPFKSQQSFAYWIKIVKKNMGKTISIFMDISLLSIPILIFTLIFSFNFSRHKNLFFLFISLLIFTSGYLLILMMDRYIWIDEILILLMGTYLLAILFKHRPFSKLIFKVIIFSVFAFTFLVWPYRFYLKTHEHLYVDPIKSTDREIYQESLMIKKVLRKNEHRRNNLIGRNLKPHQINMASNCSWNRGLFTSYYLKLRYYGIMRENSTLEQLEKDLEKFNIDYFFIWYASPETFKFLNAYPEITKGKIPALSIFYLKSK